MRHGRGPILCAALILAALAGGLLPAAAGAQSIVADITAHVIAINSRFDGTSIVVFGTWGVRKPSDHVVVTVRGPEHDETIRRKERFAGIWLNATGVTFLKAPAFYAVLADQPIETLLSPASLKLEGIGPDALTLAPAPIDAAKPPQQLAEFHAAFIRAMQRDQLYTAQVGRIEFLGPTLFRATIGFPASLPIGSYTVTVFLVRDGAVLSTEMVPLIVTRTGLQARIHDFAAERALPFGIFAVLAAAMAGWAGSAVFRAR